MQEEFPIEHYRQRRKWHGLVSKPLSFSRTTQIAASRSTLSWPVHQRELWRLTAQLCRAGLLRLDEFFLMAGYEFIQR
jgi:hypothetical protein